MDIKFIVDGCPQGKGRPRFTKSGRTYTPKNTVQYEKEVVKAFQEQCGGVRFGDTQMLDLRITAYYAIPKSDSRDKRTKKLVGATREWHLTAPQTANGICGGATRSR